MRRKDIIRLLLVCMTLTATFLVFRASSHTAENSSKERLEQPGNERGPGKITWETLSPQFFTTL